MSGQMWLFKNTNVKIIVAIHRYLWWVSITWAHRCLGPKFFAATFFMNTPRRLVEGGRGGGSSIHSVAAVISLALYVLPEVGAERIGDTVEQIRLKYVPSGPNRATAQHQRGAVAAAVRCGISRGGWIFLTQNLHSHTACWHIKNMCSKNYFLQISRKSPVKQIKTFMTF